MSLIHALQILIPSKQAYFELGMSVKREHPIILKTYKINNKDVKTILRSRDFGYKYRDFPRPYTIESIGKYGVRKLDANECFDFQYILWFSFLDNVRIQGLAETARICYIVSEVPFVETFIEYFLRELGDYTNATNLLVSR